MTETAPPVVLIADLFPGAITDVVTGERPVGVPKNAKLHIILATTEVVVGWEVGSGEIGTWRTDLTEEDTAGADHNGGDVGGFRIQRAGGCSCGKALKRWNPYAGRMITQSVRQTEPSYGLPTNQRYTRVR